jgi:hypothetical protein
MKPGRERRWSRAGLWQRPICVSGRRGNIYDSWGGINWAQPASTGTGDGTGLGAITHGNGMFVTVWASGTIVISVNGTCKWTQLRNAWTADVQGCRLDLPA